MPPLASDHQSGAALESDPEPLFTTSAARYPPPAPPAPQRAHNPPPYNNNANGNARITFFENPSSEQPDKPTRVYYPFEHQSSDNDYDDKFSSNRETSNVPPFDHSNSNTYPSSNRHSSFRRTSRWGGLSRLSARPLSAATFATARQSFHTATLKMSKEDLDDNMNEGLMEWFIIFNFALLGFTGVGLTLAWGVMQGILSERGLSSSTALSWIGSIQSFVIMPFAPINNWIYRKWGCRFICFLSGAILVVALILASFFTNSYPIMLLTMGVMLGESYSIIFLVGAVLPAQYFKKRLGVSTGICYASFAIGGAVWGIVARLLSNKYGIEWMCRIFAFIGAATMIPPSFFLKDRIKDVRKVPIIDVSFFRNKDLIAVFLITALTSFPIFVPMFYNTNYIVALGEDSSVAPTIAAIGNVASGVGRIAFGLLADKIGATRSSFLAIICVTIGTCIVWNVATDLSSYIAFLVITNGCWGGVGALFGPMIRTILNTPDIRTATSTNFLAFGPGYLVGSPIAGYIIDASGGAAAGITAYKYVIVYCGLLTFLSMFVTAFLARQKTWQTIKDEEDNQSHSFN